MLLIIHPPLGVIVVIDAHELAHMVCTPDCSGMRVSRGPLSSCPRGLVTSAESVAPFGPHSQELAPLFAATEKRRYSLTEYQLLIVIVFRLLSSDFRYFVRGF